MIDKLINYMEKMFLTFVGRKTKIIEIPKGSEDLGYTSSRGDIHIGFFHTMLYAFDEKLRKLFLIGVFAHEMLHQVFTDFRILEETLAKLDRPTGKVVSLLSNVLEDPYIEYHAPAVFGGTLLKALRFTIKMIYAKSPGIEESDSPFSELVNALIQFGDMGLIKGKFTDDLAFDCFKQIALEFNKLVKSSTPKERMDAAERWAELIRPLWERDENLDNTVKKLQSKNGISDYSSSCNDPSESQGENGEPIRETPEQRRRDKASGQKNGQSSADKGSEAGDGEGQDGQKPEDSESKNGSGSGDGEGQDGQESGAAAGMNGQQSGIGDGQAGKDENRKGDEGDKISSDPDSESDPSNENDPNGSFGSAFSDEESANEICYDELELTDEDVEDAEKQIEEATRRDANEIPYIQDLDFDVPSRFYSNVKCANHRLLTAAPFAKTAYTEIVQKHEKEIGTLYSALKTIFNQDQDEMIRAVSGKYNIKRGMLGTTLKFFDKRRICEHVDDISVMMVIDESGSMNAAGKMDVARDTAVIFAEVFSRLHIPLYVMGFTSDNGEADVVHDHFITWSNTKKERWSLTAMHAQANNFDGYSIRYASKLLNQRKSEHKLMFVISDGYPSCRKYRSLSHGLADTKDAIKTAKKSASVFGIGLGDCSPQIIKNLYDDTFVHVSKVEALPAKAIEILKQIVKNY